MSWFRVDNLLLTSPKLAHNSSATKLAYIASLAYCSAHLTDGFIPASAVSEICRAASTTKRVVKPLVESELWLEQGKDYRIKDYLEYQRSRAEVEAEREKWRRLKAKQRSSKAEMSTVDSSKMSTGESTPTRHDTTHTSVKAAAQFTVTARDELVAAALQKMIDAKAATTQVRNPDAWRHSMVEKLTVEHGPALAAHLDQHPNATVDELARDVLGIKPTLALVASLPDCTECDNVGWLSTDNGSVPCTCEHGKRAEQSQLWKQRGSA